MKAHEIVELVIAILSALGGGSAIVFGFSSWMGKVWANRLMVKETAQHAKELETLRMKLSQENESYKIKLKKSEFIFQKEFEAASEMVELRRSIMPPIRYPDMDWADACEDIASNFTKIESALERYLSKHGAILAPPVCDLISEGLVIAGNNKFYPESRESRKAADDLCDKLEAAEKKLLEQVHSQSKI